MLNKQFKITSAKSSRWILVNLHQKTDTHLDLQICLRKKEDEQASAKLSVGFALGSEKFTSVFDLQEWASQNNITLTAWMAHALLFVISYGQLSSYHELESAQGTLLNGFSVRISVR